MLILIIIPFASYAHVKAKVVRIIDGDTIVVKYDNRQEIIRLLNINTPEKDQDGFFESKAFITALIINEDVELEPDKKEFKKDKYQRILAYIWIGDKNVNILIVHAGWSPYWIKYGKSKYDIEFMEAEKRARLLKKGIWKYAEKVD